jgi:hypothetical protein
MGRRVQRKLASKIAATALAATVGVPVAAGSVETVEAVVTDKTPYYMCFAYTQDGMLFAGGDYSLPRAQKLMAVNCNLPKALTVVLLRTLMVRRNGKMYSYALEERKPH